MGLCGAQLQQLTIDAFEGAFKNDPQAIQDRLYEMAIIVTLAVERSLIAIGRGRRPVPKKYRKLYLRSPNPTLSQMPT